ncbi:MAG: PIN domain-containing protein, partial [Pyrinomonadaceae bacterium]
MSKENKFAFPDTNIFLHFQFFTEIVWNEVLQAQSVTLVIPPIVVKELDKHKYNHASERVKDRASKVTKKFAEILRSSIEIRPKVNIQFERIEPQSEFEKYNLSKESQDDHLIASILRFQNESDINAVLITNDFSLIVKAHQLNVEVFELPEEYQNKSEENPDKKKIAILEKELFELKARTPKLKLISENDEEKITAQIFSVEQLSEIEIEREINKIKEENPQIKETFKPKRTITPIINGKPYPNDKVEFILPSGKTKQASLSSVEKFNDELDQFYIAYEKYLNEKNRVINLRSRTVKLNLKLQNEGTLPA